MRQLPSACVIGAGSSGIAAGKALHDRGIPFDCFEKSDRVGGNWVFGNTQRDVVGLSVAAHQHVAPADGIRRLPMPASYPDFPHHTQIAALLRLLRRPFRLPRPDHASRPAWSTPSAIPTASGRSSWRPGEQRRYDALVVANGHHWDPRWPEPPFPGSFEGEQLHAHHYIDNSGSGGTSNVLVVGIGNSAMDIAVESSFVAQRTILSIAARRLHPAQVPVRPPA